MEHMPSMFSEKVQGIKMVNKCLTFLYKKAWSDHSGSHDRNIVLRPGPVPDLAATVCRRVMSQGGG
jgi:hypothetical protein